MRPWLTRSALTSTIVLLAGEISPARADWAPEGVPLCTGCVARHPLIGPDGAGGAYVVWLDSRNVPSTGTDDLYLQRVTASGDIAPGWPPDGLPVCTNPAIQALWLNLAPDGDGGVFVVWEDYRGVGSGGTSVDVYAQHVLAAASVAPGWPADGLAVGRAPGVDQSPVVLGDGTGGAFVAWDEANTADVFLQRLTANGEVHPGWPSEGLLVCGDPGPQGSPLLAPDGAGGVLIAWGDLREGVVGVYAQRITAEGAIAPGWTANGVRVVSGRALRDWDPDGAGGAYLACATFGFADDDYFVQRLTGSGAIAPGWPAGGVPICLAPDVRDGLQMAPDGAGGALLAWSDYRDYWDDEVFLQRVRPDGTLSPGWPTDGLRVTDNEPLDTAPVLAPDGLGGAYLCWDRYFLGDYRVAVQRVLGTAAPAPGWPIDGHVIASAVRGGNPQVTANGAGGVVVAWESGSRIRALCFAVDGPVAVTIALTGVEATPEGVTLHWHGEGLAGLAATVYRRTAAQGWEPLGRADPEGPQGLRYEDRAVTSGARYGYRLGYADMGEERFTAETWVVIPFAYRLALGGFRPNPAGGNAKVTFELPDAAPARLEVFDVAGRRVAGDDVGGLGPGVHVHPIGRGRPLRPGVYLVRLTHGGRALIARGVVTE